MLSLNIIYIKLTNKEKYDIYPIYIDKNGMWWKTEIKRDGEITFGEEIENTEKIENIIQYKTLINSRSFFILS